MKALIKTLVPALLTTLIHAPAQAENHISQTAENIFLPENAILDTSIPFAIGAREAQQELRGSYGWDTFQEGLVEGVYFRFDPDGYARFSPNARLDSDLFEVICRPRTLNCIARKGDLTIVVNGQGQLKLEMEGIANGDQYFIADVLSEFELPDRIWQPLDARFENVLAVGGELVVRRGQNEVTRVSLVGFSAVTSYLRWILAEQDYLALPRNWPIPNSNSGRTSTNLTTVSAWRDTGSSRGETLAVAISDSEAATAINETADELAALRALVEQMTEQQTSPEGVDTTATQGIDGADIATGIHVGAPGSMDAIGNYLVEIDELEFQLAKSFAQILDLESRVFELELAALHEDEVQESVAPADPPADDNEELLSENKEPLSIEDSQSQNELVVMAEQIDRLTKEFGLEPNVAMLLLQLQNGETQQPPGTMTSLDQIDNLFAANTEITQAPSANNQPAMVDEPEVLANQEVSEPKEIRDETFVLLTDYFKSVAAAQN